MTPEEAKAEQPIWAWLEMLSVGGRVWLVQAALFIRVTLWLVALSLYGLPLALVAKLAKWVVRRVS